MSINWPPQRCRRVDAVAMLPVCVLLACALLGGARALPRHETIDPQISGGSYVTIETVPWQVSVEKDKAHLCGGSILSVRWVLTAASCLKSDDSSPASPSDFGVRYATKRKETDGTLLAVTWIGYHDRYDSDLNKYDVGLLQVDTDIEFSAKAQPVVLPAIGTTPRATDVLTITGWGFNPDDYYDDGSDYLLAVTIPYIPRATCNTWYSSEGTPVGDTMICAGVRDKGFCDGDTGGALVDAFGVQVGIASWIFGCAEGYPDVYTNLGDAGVRDFITKKTGVA